MIICLCETSTDQDIGNAIADGAHTVEQVGRRCGAGTGCGACREYIAEMLDEARAACPGGGRCMDCPRTREAA